MAATTAAPVAHTPGRWEITDGIDVRTPTTHIARLKGLQDMQVRHEDAAGCIAEQDANARLIAAAPDLLAALRKTYAYMSARTLINGELATCAMARAAIAKAEGRS